MKTALKIKRLDRFGKKETQENLSLQYLLEKHYYKNNARFTNCKLAKFTKPKAIKKIQNICNNLLESASKIFKCFLIVFCFI